jgi:hypothetical protein
MDIYLFSILFLISIILLLLNFFKKQIIIGIFAGIFFILCGLLLWNGLTYVSGYNENKLVPCADNCTPERNYEVNNVTYVYSTWSEDVTDNFSDFQSCYYTVNFNLSRKFKPTLPSVMPNLINKSSISLFNNMLYQSSKPSSINHLYKELFPLDSVRNWFSVFGKFGLAEFQFTFKLENIQDVHKLILHYRKENIPALGIVYPLINSIIDYLSVY